jgi:hypothetical protein
VKDLAKVRIYKLAEELNVPSKDLVDILLEDIGKQ